LVHALNYDALGVEGGHIGLAAVPTTLALAERYQASGKEFLAAVCAGAEFTCRLGASLTRAGPKLDDKFLEGQVLGYFGAVAGAARVLRFDPLKVHNAFGLALMQAAGTRQVSLEGGAAKALYGGFPNLGAVLSTAMAAQGIDARCAVLEGQAGLYSLFFGGRFDRSVLSDGLEAEFLASRLAFKPWPISSVVQPFVEAALALRQSARIKPASIRRVRLEVGPRAVAWIEPVDERRKPQNLATASNSIPFCLAKALTNGGLALADFAPGPEGISQPEALRIAELVEYSVDEHASVPGRVLIELRGSGIISGDVTDECSVPTLDGLIRKFRDCAQYSRVPLAESRVDALVEMILGLENIADVAELTGLLRQP
jgi:2-methylcitrate dehydratase PrpD